MPVILPVGALPVFWDINRCPIPDDCDARRVGPCIEGFLRNLGHSVPISITAIGRLSEVPQHILEAVSSAGICLYNVPDGPTDIVSHILIYFARNPRPAHVMLISPPRYFNTLFRELAKKDGCNIILPFPSISIKSHANALWENLLLADPEDVNCSETVEPASWVCGVCDDLPGRDFENFLKHIFSPEHAREFCTWFPPQVEVNPGNVTTMVSAEATNVEHSFPENVTTMVSA